MIKIIYGWYNPKNPLFGWQRRVDVGDIHKSFLPRYLEEVVKVSQTQTDYDLYVHTDKKMIKELKKIIDNRPELKNQINLFYDNGNKFWLIDWDNINSMFEQAKKDKEQELF